MACRVITSVIAALFGSSFLLLKEQCIQNYSCSCRLNAGSRLRNIAGCFLTFYGYVFRLHSVKVYADLLLSDGRCRAYSRPEDYRHARGYAAKNSSVII